MLYHVKQSYITYYQIQTLLFIKNVENHIPCYIFKNLFWTCYQHAIPTLKIVFHSIKHALNDHQIIFNIQKHLPTFFSKKMPFFYTQHKMQNFRLLFWQSYTPLLSKYPRHMWCSFWFSIRIVSIWTVIRSSFLSFL